LDRQSPFVNSTLAQHALGLLARLFRYGEISYQGAFINLASGATAVLRIDPQSWKRNRRMNKHATLPMMRQAKPSTLSYTPLDPVH
jgi:hypothetical protein